MKSKLQPTNNNESALGVWLMIIISALLCLGALMVFSAGATVTQQLNISEFWRFTTLKRLFFVPIVWLILAVVSRLNYRKLVINEEHALRSPIFWLMGISLVMLVLVLLIGTEINGARRWMKFGPSQYNITFQPSELAKWVTVMFLAAYVVWRGDKIKEFWRGFLPGCLVLMLVVGLIGKEDFGTAAVVAAVGAVVLLVGGVKWWHMLNLVPAAAAAFYFLVVRVPYRWVRLVAHWQQDNPDSNLAEKYHAQQSITAIGSGGFWGRGLGGGTMKYGYVPEDTSDFIFAPIGEELGFVGCALVIVLYTALLFCSMLVINRANHKLGALLVTGIAGMIGAQALMNLMVVSGLAPTKGIALPFVSVGGSGLVMTALAAGVLINVARQGNDPATVPP